MLTIDGVVYEPVGPDSYTIEYDHYVTGLLQEAGVLGALEQLKDLPVDEAGNQRRAQAVLGAVVTANRTPELLAAVMVPRGEAWSPATARMTADRVGSVTSRRLRGQLTQVLCQGIGHFFLRGPRSSTIFH